MQNNRVIFGTYNHMPEGASEAEFELRYQSSWRPFLSVLYRFPEVSSMLFYSGTVLKWLELRHPEFLMLLEEMLQRKQIELLGGAYFNPLLSLLPPSDRLGQIELLTTSIRKTFGKRPLGGWLYEYMWDPSFASLLQTSGFDYSFLPESVFRMAGSTAHGTGRPVITEDQGKTVCIFPVHDMAEFPGGPEPFETAFERLTRERPDATLFTMMADGALTEPMWRNAGLESPDVMFERSFAWFQRYQLETETTTAQKFMRSQRRFDVAFFPSAASSRLMESAGGGSPRSIIVRTRAARKLYARMQYVHLLAGQVKGDKSRKKSAHEELWKGQSGAAYWNGHDDPASARASRSAAYTSLLEAEKMTRIRGSFASGLIQTDIDFDGEREILYQGMDFNCYVQLRGASVFELDSFKARRNYSDCSDAARDCFMDTFRPHGSFGEELADFSCLSYTLKESDKPAQIAVFGREGHLHGAGSVSVRKSYVFRKAGFSVDYEIANLDPDTRLFRFVTELNLAPGLQPDFGFGILRGREAVPAESSSISEWEACDGFSIEPAHARELIRVRSDIPFALKHEPAFAEPSRAEGDFTGIESAPIRHYLGSRFLCGWDLDLPPDAARRLSLSVEFDS